MAFLKEKVKHIKVKIDCQKAVKDGEEIRVEQSHKDEVNINKIVARHGIDLLQNVAALQKWEYDDVSGNDFQEAMNALIKARDTFDKVPNKIRKHFDHDAAKFMDFVRNPENVEQLREWGLAKPPEVVVPQQVEIVNPPPVETPPE
jgi:DNA-binding ferritin-like protein (Dps family)